MNEVLRRKISMARRAFDFATAHPVTDSGFTTVLTRLNNDVNQADTVGMLQEAGLARRHLAVGRRSKIKNSMRSLQLRRLCRVANLGAAEHPELAGKFNLPPRKAPNHSFLLKARTLLDDAIAEKDVLATLGLGDTFIDELTASVADFETATEEAHAARADHVGASAELLSVTNRCVGDVDVLDTYMQKAFANDQQTLAGWNAASNVVGPFKAVADAPSPAPAPAPAPEPSGA